MKPIALKLQAFGSYAREFDVDFQLLSAHGTFAITGPTGSGKTTIFDGIVYALFGELPGYRTDKTVRSQYAATDLATEVTFTFEVRAERWTITRSPAWERPKARGTGVTPQTAVCRLAREGDAVGALTRKAEVEAKIGELIGLDAGQFQQVVLLPQGEFEKVLKADTADRLKLLKKLFPTDLYQQVSRELEELAAARGEALKEAQRSSQLRIDALADAWHQVLDQLPTGVSARPIDAPDTPLATLSDHLPSAQAHETERTSSSDADAADGSDAEEHAADGSDAEERPADSSDSLAFDETRLDGHIAEAQRLLDQIADLLEEATDQADQAVKAEAHAAARQQAFEEWSANTAKAVHFAAEAEADEKRRTALERAKRLAGKRDVLDRWQVAVAEEAEATSHLARCRTTVHNRWIEDYDQAELDSPELFARVKLEEARLDLAAREFAAIDEKCTEQARLATALATAEAEETAAVAKIEALAVDRHSAAAGIDALEVRAAMVALGQAEVERLTLELERAETRAKHEAALVVAKASVTAAQEAKDLALQESRRITAAWLGAAAGRLAQTLVDGDPCPTCGSTDHPAAAVLHDDAPSDEERDAAEKVVAEAEQRERDHSAEVSALEGKLSTFTAVLSKEELSAQLATARVSLADAQSAATELTEARTTLARLDHDHAEVSDALMNAKAQTAAARGARDHAADDLQRLVDTYEATHGALADPRARVESTRALSEALGKLEEARRAHARATDNTAAALALLSDPLDEFGVDDPALLVDELCEETEIAAEEATLQRRRDERIRITSAIAEYESGDGARAPVELEPLRTRVKDTQDRRNDLSHRHTLVDQSVQTLTRGPATLGAAVALIEQARQASSEATTLASICTGKAAGPVQGKLSLEVWVLSTYLRQVLLHASARLKIMTGGRYALRVSGGDESTPGDRRRASGLDIEAFDANTGQWRAATTLSGGETFMAALALALGLADVVSGGSNRQIGALFVDEGFGSLDPDSLDAVITVLRTLEAGGRTVGVISHVEELKQALPSGITVVTTPTGSEATAHYPEL